MRLVISLFVLIALSIPALTPSAHAAPGKTLVGVAPILSAVTVTGAGSNFTPWGAKKTFQATGTTSASTGAATIVIQGSNVASTATTDWVTIGTITLSLSTTSAGDGFVSDAPWKYVRANVTAISGTTATVTVYLGQE